MLTESYSMNRCMFSLFLLTSSLCGFCASFQNLDFDSANTNRLTDICAPNHCFYGSLSDLLPGWQLSNGANVFGPNSPVGYNLELAGLPYDTILGASNPDNRPFEGLYSLALYSAREPPLTGTLTPFSLWQVGAVPSDAKSIHFLNFGFSAVELLINGSPVPLLLDGSFDHTRVHLVNAAADISVYAGQSIELRFTTTDHDLSGLDSISFSDQPVPEPGALALFCVGALLLLWRFRLRSGSY